MPVRIDLAGGGKIVSHYLGWAGGLTESSAPNALELSNDLALLLGLDDGMLVSAQIEYSFAHLDSLELEPLTPQDFEVLEKNSEFVEENLLNQMQIFYRD